MTEALHFVLTDPAQARLALSHQMAPHCRRLWSEGIARIRVTVEPEDDARTLQQLRFLWGVVYKETSEQARIEGVKYTPEAWHELGKRLHLPPKKKTVRVAGRKRPVVTVTIGSTRGLSVKKMGVYIEKFMAWVATDFGVVFSASKWEEWRDA